MYLNFLPFPPTCQMTRTQSTLSKFENWLTRRSDTAGYSSGLDTNDGNSDTSSTGNAGKETDVTVNGKTT